MYVRQLPGLANRTSAAEIVAASACIASGLPRRYFDYVDLQTALETAARSIR